MFQIWSNEITQDMLDEEKEIYLNDNPEMENEATDDLYFDLARERIQNEFEDEICNLDINMTGEIFLMGTLERWDGAHAAYKPLSAQNIGDAIKNAVNCFDGDNTFEIGIEDGKLLIKQWGHDNPTSPSVFEFRSVQDHKTLEDMIFAEDSDSHKTMLSHSVSPAKQVCDVYGWDLSLTFKEEV